MSTTRILFALVLLGAAVLAATSASAEGFTSDGFAPDHSVTPAADNDRHYLVVLTYQSADNAIENSHTFAVFARTSGDGGQRRLTESFTISWLPVSGIISAARPAEPGINQSLAATLAGADRRRLQVTLHGPYEIRLELFRRAAQQAARLNRGDLRYKAFDRFGRDGAKNCIHAIADIVDEHGRLNSGAKRGDESAAPLLQHFRAFLESDHVAPDADELLTSLNLERFSPPAADMLAAGH